MTYEVKIQTNAGGTFCKYVVTADNQKDAMRDALRMRRGVVVGCRQVVVFQPTCDVCGQNTRPFSECGHAEA